MAAAPMSGSGDARETVRDGGRPLVGVTSSVRGGRTLWWLNRLALRRAGAGAVRLTAAAPFPVERLDGLVIGGGDDIDATLYGGTVEPAVRIDPDRDRLERGVLEQALRRDLPVLGICRGAQMINVHFGGTLHTDIHEVYIEAPRMRTVLPRKVVDIDPDSRLFRILGFRECRVNALHHQSVDRLGCDLRVVARDRHGIVQGIEMDRRPFLIGVQWHPEFLVTQASHQRLFRELVACARQRRETPAEAVP